MRVLPALTSAAALAVAAMLNSAPARAAADAGARVTPGGRPPDVPLGMTAQREVYIELAGQGLKCDDMSPFRFVKSAAGVSTFRLICNKKDWYAVYRSDDGTVKVAPWPSSDPLP